ncbi:hypothetical protein DY000_02041472 [Brassica cretica]|uniref:Ku70/Ku80 C-terminal arm domain-containing protein n=1 Tax=Brassica cretica TaxID=69181 RepID=A0ABQ7BB46_BRACR|nr:hypothetical protein DY000_02041472 [Brassica cretica]
MPTREEFLCFLKQKPIGDGTPTLQRHYAILQAIALDEDELRETRYETLPDEEGEGMNMCSNSDKPSYPSRDQHSRFKGSPFWVWNTTTPKTTSSSSSLDQEDQKIAMANEKIVRLENDKTYQGKVMKYLHNLAHKIVSKFPEFLDGDEDEDATQE